MSLFSAIQGSSNALRVNQLGLQVVSNNIANANTPGYVRQDLIQTQGLGYQYGSTIMAEGVRVQGVRQTIDEFVLKQMRDTKAQLTQNESLQQANSQLETALSELGDQDISSAMSRYSNSMQDVANQPGNASMKMLAVQRGTELAGSLNRLSNKITNYYRTSDSEIDAVAANVNRLTDSIATLNQRIVALEGGRTTNSDAVGLRDERIKALDELSSLVDLDAVEQTNGSVTVIVGGDYVVADGLSRKVKVANGGDIDKPFREVRLTDTDAALHVSAGQLRGLYDARDSVAKGFLGRLDTFTRNLIAEVNSVHSQGQGSEPFTRVLGEPSILNSNLPVEQAGKNFDIKNGSFTIQLHDQATGQTKTTEIIVKQNGDESDTTVDDIVTQLNAVSGIQAAITGDGQLQIQSNSSAIKFSFSDDTSGTLSALGINTFFKGDSASTIKVRDELTKDPSQLAISLNGPGNGSDNAIKLAEVLNKPTSRLNNVSLSDSFETFVADTTQNINSQASITDGLKNFYQTLEAKHLGVSGVSLDEEGIKMMLYQRAFQASSRVIATANEMLKTLAEMI